jgi:hypothetical protein
MKIVGTLAFILLAFAVNAQTVAVELTEMNVIYRGAKNPVRIAISGVADTDLVVKTTENITYHKTEDAEYITAEKLGIGIIYVGKKQKKDTLWLHQSEFRIHNMPPPQVQFGGIPNDGKPHSRNAVLAQTSLYAAVGSSFAGDYRPCPFLGAKLVIVGKEIQYFEMADKVLTPEIRSAIRNLRDGSIIRFYDIRIIDPRTKDTITSEPIEIMIGHNNEILSRHLLYIRGSDTNVYKQNWQFSSGPHQSIDSILAVDNSIISGKLIYFYSNPNFNYRIEKTYLNREVIKEVAFDEMGNKMYIMKRLDKIAWKYTSYYENGALFVKTTLYDITVFVGNETYLACCNRSWIADTCFVDLMNDVAKDVYQVVQLTSRAPVEKFESFYPDGKLKCSGNIALQMGYLDIEKGKEVCGRWHSADENFSVMDGDWFFYYEGKEVILRRTYEMGQLKN